MTVGNRSRADTHTALRLSGDTAAAHCTKINTLPALQTQIALLSANAMSFLESPTVQI
jgi:hypothetical protein